MSGAAAVARDLTARERQIVALLADGLTSAQIGARLYLAPETVRGCIRAITRKLQARNRTHAVAIAVSLGLVG